MRASFRFARFQPLARGVRSATALALMAMPQLAHAKYRICFLSMNNDQEFKAFQAQYRNVPDLEVRELMPISGRDPLNALKDGIEKLRVDDPAHPYCDGLVLSGHHNGEWWGARTSAPLKLDDLEALKCDPQTAPFFDNVQALWMQGCNTMDENQGAEIPSGGTSRPPASQPSVRHNPNANFHVTPRYASLFTQADLYAWQGIAPGVKSGSPDSMILFMEGFATTHDDALIAAMNRGRTYSKASDADISAILPEVFGCQDVTETWSDPQNQRYFAADDRRRPRAQLARDHRSTTAPAPVCPARNSAPTQPMLDQMMASPENLEASVRALADQIQNSSPEQRKKSQALVRKQTRLLQYLQEQQDSPNASPTDQLEYATLAETLTGMKMPAEKKKKIEQALDQQLANGMSYGEEPMLETLRMAAIAADAGMMTPERWQVLGESMAKASQNSDAAQEIIAHGAEMIDEASPESLPPELEKYIKRKGRTSSGSASNGKADSGSSAGSGSGPSGLGGELSSPATVKPGAAPSRSPTPEVAARPSPAPSRSPSPTPSTRPAPAPSREAPLPAPSPSVPAAQPRPKPPIPSPSPARPGASPKPAPSAAIGAPGATAKSGSAGNPQGSGAFGQPMPQNPPATRAPGTPPCQARPGYQFGAFDGIPASAACEVDLKLDTRCAADPWCWVPKCEQAGCISERLCQSPSRPALSQDSCVKNWQQTYARDGRDLLNDPKSCTRSGNCQITHTCVSKRWHATQVIPNLKYGNWFCNSLGTPSQCGQYQGCIWIP